MGSTDDRLNVEPEAASIEMIKKKKVHHTWFEKEYAYMI